MSLQELSVRKLEDILGKAFLLQAMETGPEHVRSQASREIGAVGVHKMGSYIGKQNSLASLKQKMTLDPNIT